MKINIKRGQSITLRVQAPVSKEIFTVLLEPVLDQEPPMMPKDSSFAVGDYQSYDNFVSEREKENSRLQIRAAAERLKNPANYGPHDAYSNLVAIEYGVGSSNPKMAQKQKEAGIL